MPQIETEAAQPAWHALWTRSHCERLVSDQLEAKGFHPFLPILSSWSARGGRQHQVGLPMFPGYLFLPDVLAKLGYIEVRKVRGLVGLLGRGWDELAVIPCQQIEAIQRLAAADIQAAPHPFLRAGQRVRVVCGPLAGTVGILVGVKANKGRLVVSIELLQRSVSAEIDCSAVALA